MRQRELPPVSVFLFSVKVTDSRCNKKKTTTKKPIKKQHKLHLFSNKLKSEFMTSYKNYLTGYLRKIGEMEMLSFNMKAFSSVKIDTVATLDLKLFLIKPQKLLILNVTDILRK